MHKFTQAIKRIAASFGWLRQSVQWVVVAGLLGLAIAAGVWAYERPLVYRLDIGAHDVPLLTNTTDRFSRDRYLRADSGIYLGGISANHPITLSILTGGYNRPDVKAGKVVSFTISVNGHTYPDKRMFTENRWYRWRITPDVIKGDRLNIDLRAPLSYADDLSSPRLWASSMLAEGLAIDPAPNPGQTIAPYSELEWANVGWLAGAVLLLYSLFAGARRRWLILAGLLISLGAGYLLFSTLRGDRPLFVAVVPSLVLGLLIARLAAPLLTFNPQRGALRWLCLLVLAVALLLLLSSLNSQDDVYKYGVSESLLLRGSLQLPPPQLDLGSPYSRYALGHSITTLPLLTAGLLLERLLDAPVGIRQLIVMLLNPIMAALAVMLLHCCARRLGGDQKVAVAVCLSYFFATFAITYFIGSTTEPLLTVLLLFSFYAMLRVFDPVEPTPRRWLLVAGCALGYMVFCKEETVLPVAVFSLWWLLRRSLGLRQAARQRGRAAATILFEGVRLAGPIATFLLADLAYNYARTGGLFNNGYTKANIVSFDTPLLVGLYGLLFSTGRGLLWFAPPVIVAFWATSTFLRRWRWEGGLILSLFSVGLIFYSLYYYWAGGVAWGPRFLLPYLPLLMLMTSATLQQWAGWQRWQRLGYKGLVAVGGLVFCLGTLTVPAEAWLRARFNTPSSTELNEFFAPMSSQLGAAWLLLTRGNLQPFASFQLAYYRFPGWFATLWPGLLLATIGLAAMQLYRLYFEPATSNAPVAQPTRPASLPVAAVQGGS